MSEKQGDSEKRGQMLGSHQVAYLVKGFYTYYTLRTLRNVDYGKTRSHQFFR